MIEFNQVFWWVIEADLGTCQKKLSVAGGFAKKAHLLSLFDWK